LFYVISSHHAEKRKNKQNNYYFYIKKEIGTKFVLLCKNLLVILPKQQKDKDKYFAHYIAKNTPKEK
jgi:hypothetical protein